MLKLDLQKLSLLLVGPQLETLLKSDLLKQHPLQAQAPSSLKSDLLKQQPQAAAQQPVTLLGSDLLEPLLESELGHNTLKLVLLKQHQQMAELPLETSLKLDLQELHLHLEQAPNQHRLDLQEPQQQVAVQRLAILLRLDLLLRQPQPEQVVILLKSDLLLPQTQAELEAVLHKLDLLKQQLLLEAEHNLQKNYTRHQEQRAKPEHQVSQQQEITLHLEALLQMAMAQLVAMLSDFIQLQELRQKMEAARNLHKLVLHALLPSLALEATLLKLDFLKLLPKTELVQSRRSACTLPQEQQKKVVPEHSRQMDCILHQGLHLRLQMEATLLKSDLLKQHLAQALEQNLHRLDLQEQPRLLVGQPRVTLLKSDLRKQFLEMELAAHLQQ
jgi:hypothetical protein